MEKPKVLYVDDEEINLQLFKINLSKKYKVLVADNGLKGLELIAENPDLKVVISDMKMPQMNGIEFISKAKENYPSISFFILTGYEITKEIQCALDEGLILKYFRKPFDMNLIDVEISKVL